MQSDKENANIVKHFLVQKQIGLREELLRKLGFYSESLRKIIDHLYTFMIPLDKTEYEFLTKRLDERIKDFKDISPNQSIEINKSHLSVLQDGDKDNAKTFSKALSNSPKYRVDSANNQNLSPMRVTLGEKCDVMGTSFKDNIMSTFDWKGLTMTEETSCRSNAIDLFNNKPLSYFTLFDKEKNFNDSICSVYPQRNLERISEADEHDDSFTKMKVSKKLPAIGYEEFTKIKASTKYTKKIKSILKDYLIQLSIEKENNSIFMISTSMEAAKPQVKDYRSAGRRNKYQMFNAELKHKAIDYAMIHGIRRTCEIMNIPLKSLKRWIITGAERRKGGGRKIKDPQMEVNLIEWYRDFVEKKGNKVTAKLIKEMALKLSNNPDFIASKGWLEKFRLKYNLKVSREKEMRSCSNSYND